MRGGLVSGGLVPGAEARPWAAPGRDRLRSAGQGIVEFGAILALAAAVAVLALVLFRPQLAFVLSLIGSEVEKSSWVTRVLALA